MNEHAVKMVNDQQRARFNKNFVELVAFLSTNNRFPGKFEHPRLYNWINKLRSLHKKGIIENNKVMQLNTIGFVWNLRDMNWFNRAQDVKTMLKNNTIPSSADHLTYNWLRDGLSQLIDKSLTVEKRAVMEEINTMISDIKTRVRNESTFLGEKRERRYKEHFKALVEFRENNPIGWPQPYSPDKNERRLATWCNEFRNHFKNKILDKHWITKLEAIGFSFERDKLKGWKKKLMELNQYLLQNKEIPGLENPLHTWARKQYVDYNYLLPEQQTLLKAIDFLRYFEYKRVEEYSLR